MAPAGENVTQQHAGRTRELIEQLDAGTQIPGRRSSWWRRMLGMGPSTAEIELNADLEAIRTNFGRPITIAVNGSKGGTGKTPTAIGLSGEFGDARGGGVVLLDDDEVGTLAQRTYAPPPAQRLDLGHMLAAKEWLLDPARRIGDVQQGLNYQAAGQFWTLLSCQGSTYPVSAEEFATLHTILARFFSVIIVDNGNNNAGQNWLAANRHADAVVVPLKWSQDHLIKTQQMLDTLAYHDPSIAERLVIVGTNGPGDLDQEVQRKALGWFHQFPVIEIPTDPHLNEGRVIDRAKLHDRTREAYRKLTATVAQIVAGRVEAERDDVIERPTRQAG